MNAKFEIIVEKKKKKKKEGVSGQMKNKCDGYNQF